MSVDEKTLRVYDERAAEYAGLTADQETSETLGAFISAVVAGGRVLDLGCGPGHAAAVLSKAGFRVDAVDASNAMAEQALSLYGLKVRRQSFDQLDAICLYDGVWASFSLLHAKKQDFPRHLRAVHRALKPSGVLHLGMKTGAGEGRDALGRHYSYYSIPDLKTLLSATGFTVSGVTEGRDKSLAGAVEPWVVMAAHA